MDLERMMILTLMMMNNMINLKVKVIEAGYAFLLEKALNEFLLTIDARQIVKTEFSSAKDVAMNLCVIIYYVGIDDIRDAKIDTIIK